MSNSSPDEPGTPGREPRRLDRWVGLVANIGVLLGLLLVAAELRQSRHATRAQTRNEVATQIVDLLSQVASDPELAAILALDTDSIPLSGVQEMQYLHRVLAMLRYFEATHYQYRQGLYDAEEFRGQVDAWSGSSYAWAPTAVRIWCDRREGFSAEFRATFDSLVARPC